MEKTSALAYGEEDLPSALGELKIGWHVHLPVDLPWNDPYESAGICVKLMEKVVFLGARRAVLHPPEADSAAASLELLEGFMRIWQASGRDCADIMLENQPEGLHSQPQTLLTAARSAGASICLDLAHLLLGCPGGQDLPDGFMQRVRLLHLCAPAASGKGHHAALGELDSFGRETGRKICRAAAPDTVFMLEIFNWRGIEESLPIVAAWMEDI